MERKDERIGKHIGPIENNLSYFNDCMQYKEIIKITSLHKVIQTKYLYLHNMHYYIILFVPLLKRMKKAMLLPLVVIL